MGYSTDIFTPEPSSGTLCAVCHDVLKDASSLSCGHTFCLECITNLSYAASGGIPSCPNCRVVMRDFKPNFAVREIIEVMTVRCPNGDECGWNGQVKDIQNHDNTCLFKIVPCSVKGCGHTCQRRDMEDHLSSTAVMIRHMELKYENKQVEMEARYDKKLEQVEGRYDKKLVEMEGRYDKKLKEMEKRYKKKLAANDNKLQACEDRMKDCEDRIHTYESRMQTYRNRINAVEDKVGIDHPTLPAWAFWEPEMVVAGCGVDEINGIYKQKGELNGSPKYVRTAKYLGKDVEFSLYRRLYLSSR